MRKPLPPNLRLPDVLTTEDIAKHLSVTPKLVRRLIRDRGLPHFRLGREYRVRRRDLQNWMAAETETLPRPRSRL